MLAARGLSIDDRGDVVLVAALWGLWDVATGLALATWWRRRPAVDGSTVADRGARSRS